MTKLKVKEKKLNLKTVEPEEFIKFMIKYQEKPLRLKRIKKKDFIKTSEGDKSEKKKAKFKIDFRIKIFRK